MDPTNFYHLGQIQHQERVQAAEEYRLSKLMNSKLSRWQRLIARFAPSPVKPPMPCPDALASAQ